MPFLLLIPGEGPLDMQMLPTSSQVRNLGVVHLCFGPLCLFSILPLDPVLPLFLHFEAMSRAVPLVPMTLPFI